MAGKGVNCASNLMHITDDDDDFEDFVICPTKSNSSDSQSKHGNKIGMVIREKTPSGLDNANSNKRSRQNDKVKYKLKSVVSDSKGKAISLDSSIDASDNDSPVKKRKKLLCGPSSYSIKKRLFKVKKRAVKSVKNGDIPCLDVEPLVLYFRPDQHRSRRICTHTAVDAVHLIKKTLDERQLEMFRQSCFGYFLDMPEFITCNKLLNALLMREICPPRDDSDALWFKFYGKKFRFGLMEFGLVTGLKCVGNHLKEYHSEERNRLLQLYFGGAPKVTKRSLVECFTSKMWQSDEDAIKLAVLFFIHTFLFSTKNSANNDTMIKEKDFNLVECGAWQSFPWGTKVFVATRDSMHDKLRPYNQCYRFGGLPYALQAWYYEICPTVHDNIAYRVADTCPRILNWHVKRSYGFEELQQGFFSLKKDEITFTKIAPTEGELSTFQLPLSKAADTHTDIAVEPPQDQPAEDHPKEDHPEAPNVHEGQKPTSVRGNRVLAPDIQLLYDQQKLNQTDIARMKIYMATCFEKIFKKLDIPSDDTEGFNGSSGVSRGARVGYENFKYVDQVLVENDENERGVYTDHFNEHVHGQQQMNDDMGAKTNGTQSDVAAGFKKIENQDEFMADGFNIRDAFIFDDIDFTKSNVHAAESVPLDKTINGGDTSLDKCEIPTVDLDIHGHINVNDQSATGHAKDMPQLNDHQRFKTNGEPSDLEPGSKDIDKDVLFMGAEYDIREAFNIDDIEFTNPSAVQAAQCALVDIETARDKGKGPVIDEESDLDWGLPTPNLRGSQWHQLTAKAAEEVLSKHKGQDQIPPIHNVNITADAVYQQHQNIGNIDEHLDDVRAVTPVVQVVTPQVRARKIKPAQFKRSPFINDFGSSGSSPQLAKRRTFRLIHPFLDKIRKEPDYALVCKFSTWIDYKAIAKSKKGNVYPACKNKLHPKFNFGVHLVDKKEWFHLLNYGYKPLSTSHLDVLFYYLRKKARYDGDLDVRVTTTDCMFDSTIQGVYTDFLRSGGQMSVVDSATMITDYICGRRLRCNTPWILVDDVLFPVKVVNEWHWILARMSFKERLIYVYDSRPDLAAYNEEIIQALDAYATIIPLFLAATEFYNKRPELFYNGSPYEDKAKTDPFILDFTIKVPSLNKREYGLYAAVFAEYYIQYQCMPTEEDDLSFVRDRYTMYLWHYRSTKIIDCACSDEEN